MHPQVRVPPRSPVWHPGLGDPREIERGIYVPPREIYIPKLAAFSLLGSAKNATSSATSAVTIDSSGANLILVGTACAGGTTPTLSDVVGGNSNTYNGLTKQDSVASFGVSSRIFWCVPSFTGATHVITWAGVGTAPALCVAWYSGATASPFDVENGAQTAGATTLATGSVTPSADNYLVFSAWGNGGTATNPTNTTLTQLQFQVTQGGVNYGCAIAHQIQTTATAVNETWNWTNSAGIAETIAVFKAAAGGGGTPLFRTSLLNGLGSGGPFFHNPLG